MENKPSKPNVRLTEYKKALKELCKQAGVKSPLNLIGKSIRMSTKIKNYEFESFIRIEHIWYWKHERKTGFSIRLSGFVPYPSVNGNSSLTYSPAEKLWIFKQITLNTAKDQEEELNSFPVTISFDNE